jgi:apolipoprotein N-acyltransferase
MSEAALLRVEPGARLDTGLCRLAQEVARLEGGRRAVLAFLLGVSAAAALPPVDILPLLFVAFPGLLWLEEGSKGPWASFRLGFLFGFGFFLAGMYWVADALLVDFDRFWWFLPVALAGLPAGLALYCGLALLATDVLRRHLDLPPGARVVAFAVLWSGLEWVRGHAFTGLPWNLIGYVWSANFPGALDVLESVAWIGIYGLSFLTVLAASLPALLGAPSFAPMSRLRRWAPAIAAALLILLPGTAGALRLRASPTIYGKTWLRLVQPSIPQSLKWNPLRLQENLRRLLQLSAAPAQRKLAAILWPEAAVTVPLGRDPAERKAIGAVAPEGGYILAGAIRTDPPPGPPRHFWNSIEAIDRKGEILVHYDKAHLVPFGEFVPFRQLIPLNKITAGSVDFSAGDGPRTIALPGLPRFAPFICYEAIFPGAVVAERIRPDWMLNVTNDAWYGRSSGPYQHFAIARARAIEEGLPLVRVANSGISGVIDAQGRILTHTELDAVGYVDVALPVPGPRTLYERVGDGVFFVFLILSLLPVALRVR